MTAALPRYLFEAGLAVGEGAAEEWGIKWARGLSIKVVFDAHEADAVWGGHEGVPPRGVVLAISQLHAADGFFCEQALGFFKDRAAHIVADVKQFG